jgi:phytoene synthase
MRVGADSYHDDITRCVETLRRGSKSFFAASLLLPPRVRGPTAAVYAFCRVADDAVDDSTPREAPAALERLRARLERVYRGVPDAHHVDRAFAAVVERFGIDRALPDALLEGFEWDVTARRYETLSDVLAYSARVASAVGAMMTVLMGPRSPAVLARACDLGAAMQLTNICRDVGEDARNGRVYLPAAWLREVGLDADALIQRPTHNAALGVVVERLLCEADGLYERADLGVPMLPRDCRPAIRAARLIYADIGRVVRSRHCDAVSSRAITSTARKLALAARASLTLLSRSRAPSLRDLPCLDETRFLVDAAARGA